MKNRRFIASVLSFFIVLFGLSFESLMPRRSLAASQIFSQSKKHDFEADFNPLAKYEPEQAIVVFNSTQADNGITPQSALIREREQTLTDYNLESIEDTRELNFQLTAQGLKPTNVEYLVRVFGDLQTELARLNADPRIKFAQPRYLYQLSVVPNDPMFKKEQQPVAESLNESEAWEIATTTDVPVIILDSGCYWLHQDLRANIWTNSVDGAHGYDFVFGGSDIFEKDVVHGSLVTGAAAAVGNNGLGLAGVCWNATIYPAKISNGDGLIDGWGAVKGLKFYMNLIGPGRNAVANASWVGYQFDRVLYDAIKDFGDWGGLFVAAAGNAGFNTDEIPASPASFNLPNLISVAAYDEGILDLTGFSNFGPTSVHLAAPGELVWTTMPGEPGDKYIAIGGTSLAAPLVTGAAALVMGQLPPGPTRHLRTRELILGQVTKLAVLDNRVMSGGLLNVYGALALTRNPSQADAGPVQRIVEGQRVQFRGNETDPDADTKSFSWDFGDNKGTGDNRRFPTHKYKVPGRYVVQLTVTDALGRQSRAVTAVQVTDEVMITKALSKNSGDTFQAIATSSRFNDANPPVLSFVIVDADNARVAGVFEASYLGQERYIVSTSGVARWFPAHARLRVVSSLGGEDERNFKVK